MVVKYNRTSTIQQTGNRFTADQGDYDLVLLDKVSGKIPFKERDKAKELTKLIEKSLVKEIVVEELSRLGRNTSDVIQTIEWLETKEVNVVVRNLGLQSRPNNKPNPIWKMITAVMSSLYELELSNILERTSVGRAVYVQNGGKLGRKHGTTENEETFLSKKSSKIAITCLNKNMTIRETSKVAGSSLATVIKVKKMMSKEKNNSISIS